MKDVSFFFFLRFKLDWMLPVIQESSTSTRCNEIAAKQRIKLFEGSCCRGKSHGWRSLVGCSPWSHKESDTTERLSDFTFHFHALEKEMATQSSVLAWKIPGTGKPVGLPSMGSYRVGHDWSDLAAAAAAAEVPDTLLWHFSRTATKVWYREEQSWLVLPWWLSGKEPACQCRRHGSNPGLGRLPGEVNDNPLQ